MKIPIITKTIRRIAVWNAGVMFGLYLTFSLFTLFIYNYVLIDDLDTRLRHELEHIFNTLEVIDDNVNVLYPTELEEPDLQMVTENPFFLQVYDLEGKIFLRSENIDDYHEILLGFPNKFTPYYSENFFNQDDQIRTIYKQLINQNNTHIGYIQLSTIHSSFNKVIKNVLWFNLATLPIVLFVIVFVSIFLAKKSYNPINKIIELANNISATNLSERLEYDSMPDDELGKLKSTLNSLFDRLESQINQISRFTDNASHQLMTPLTAIKSELDFILKKDRTTKDYKETCNVLNIQTDKMIVLIKTMLLLARDGNDYSDISSVFDLSKLLKDEMPNNFEHYNVAFEIEDHIYLRGKSEYFSIVLQNLINNALKYSLDNIDVKVIAKFYDNSAVITISDQGVGINDKEKKKIFDRFYRIENPKTREIEGYGLGLSLAKSVIVSMGGTIEVKDNIPNGTIFIISLPIIELS